MSPRRDVSGASPKQLSYLKALADQTGTTFTFPRSGYQAGREIERLKTLKARRGRHLEAPRQVPDHAELPYATEQKPGEVTGYGASARRREPTPRCAAPPRQPAGSEPLELGRYVTRAGEQRALWGIRVDGKPRIIDAPVDGHTGRIYTVEQDLQEQGGYGEVKGLVADYLTQAKQIGSIPMATTRRRR